MTSGMTSFFIYFQFLMEAQIFCSSIFRSEISCDVICDVLIFDSYKTIRDLYYQPLTVAIRFGSGLPKTLKFNKTCIYVIKFKKVFQGTLAEILVGIHWK